MVAGSIQVSAELSNLVVIRHFVDETATDLKADRKVIEDMLQAVEEAVANIIFHGYQCRPGNIEVEVWNEDDMLLVRLRDQAPPFDPTTFPPPDLTFPLEQRRLSGLGIHLIRQFTDTMIHRITSEGGNELTLVKKAR
jgi:serine/threonine-protein kinase RsbW